MNFIQKLLISLGNNVGGIVIFKKGVVSCHVTCLEAALILSTMPHMPQH
jgi:hypothetical protein